MRYQPVLALLTLAMIWARGTEVSATPPSSSAGTNFLALSQGTVEIRSGQNNPWRAGRPNDPLAAGDEVRTGERSRAEIVLVSGTIIKLAALSDLQVPPIPGATMKRGIFQIFNRDRARENTLRLPGAVAAIRGTDFVVQIAENGQLSLSVLDGAVSLSNDFGNVDLTSGEVGFITPGQIPLRASLDLSNNALIQWSFYYPAVLNLDDLSFTTDESNALSRSLKAYREGHLPEAFQFYDWNRAPRSDGEKCYRAALFLSVGQVESALKTLQQIKDEAPAKKTLVTLVKAVRLEQDVKVDSAGTSSEQLATSYYHQAHGDLENARASARHAADMAPGFGFAWARLAELEFSFGERKLAQKALASALQLSARNAHSVSLNGFLLAARGDIQVAINEFDRAIELDSSYANAWLGRGLCLIRQRRDSEGQRDLFVAVTLEPQRAVYRSYLGKAFHQVNDSVHVRRELDLAKRLDPNDPTGFLYSALLDRDENRINTAINDLEHAQTTGDNRRIFRSQLLLDEDRAVRGANLAAIYREAALEEVSVREASEAVRQDYANFSAHLFLANSYNALRDASLANLRYETATFSEYLLANLLSPVGGTPLSQQVSQQQYSRFFERDRLGFSSETAYLSSGRWQQTAAQYGVWGNFAYALEGAYRWIPGDAPNASLDQRAASLQLKQQVAPDDTAYFQAVYDHFKFGDTSQRYDPSSASSTLRNHEVQEPNLFAGWHHQWSPGSHTLLLVSRLQDDFRFVEPNGRINALLTDVPNGPVTGTMAGFFGPAGESFDVGYRSEFEAISGELQQIWKLPAHTIVAGFRGQAGEVDSQSDAIFTGSPLAGFQYDTGTIHTEAESQFHRLSGYAYWQWEIVETFSTMAGITLDQVKFPVNSASVLMSDVERTENQISPKAGFTWTPHRSTRVRGAYSQSLGGLFFDSSVRLEPAQLSGFNQAFRSIAPESVAGLVPGTEFDAWDFGSEHSLPSKTYFGWQAEWLESNGERTEGVFKGVPDFSGLPAAQQSQDVEYRERSLSFYVNQLLGDGWSFGANYRVSDSEFELKTPGVSAAIWPEGSSDRAALLHQVRIHGLYNHPRGWFVSSDALWMIQNNRRDDAPLPDEDFWQLNFFAGYRSPRRLVEITVGLLNVTDQDYRLNPVSLYSRLPRERTFFTSLRLNF